MGIISKILTKGPGGPVSVAKTILQSYNTCRSLNPGMSQTDIFRQVLLSRYTSIRKLDRRQIDSAAISAESIGDLITIVIYIDIPMAFSRDMLDDTFCELEKFYAKHAPDEIESLVRIPAVLTLWRS